MSRKIEHFTSHELAFIEYLIRGWNNRALFLLQNYIRACEKRADWTNLNKNDILAYAQSRHKKLVNFLHGEA